MLKSYFHWQGLFLFLALLMLGLGTRQANALGNTFYVREDGGDITQCTGLADVPYDGSGERYDCALNHPFWVLPPANLSERDSYPILLTGGDTLIIGPGNYMMGIGAPNTGSSVCQPDISQDCVMPPIPSSSSAGSPTKISGKDGAMPRLLGKGRVPYVMNLSGNNIVVERIDISDMANCIYNSPNQAYACDRNSIPADDQSADYGIFANSGSNVVLRNMNIHGLAIGGLKVGNVSNWTLDSLTIRANGNVGWQGNLSQAPTANSGNMTVRNTKIEFNGCGESDVYGNVFGCFTTSQGGLGDGISIGPTGGTWLIEKTEISHNTSDGIDFSGQTSGTISLKRSRLEGNAGAQVKLNSSAVIENSILIGNCDYFNNKSFIEANGFEHCGSRGNSLALGLAAARQIALVNSTLVSRGDSLVSTYGIGCNGSEKLISRNNIFFGGPDFNGGDWSNLYYAGGSDGLGGGTCGALALDNRDSIVYSVKQQNLCPNSDNVECVDPKFVGPLSGDLWNVSLVDSSPAVNKNSLAPGSTVLGSVIVPMEDYAGLVRPSGGLVDWGAFEYGFSSGIGSSGSIDLNPPSRSSGAPLGVLADSVTSINLTLTTDENAICRYSVYSGIAYNSMANSFSSSGGTRHSTVVSGLSKGNSYTYYIRCSDLANNFNTNDYSITFSIGGGVVSSSGGTSSSGGGGSAGSDTGLATCTSWEFTEWSPCINGEQTRFVTKALPSGCFGGTPEYKRKCVTGEDEKTATDGKISSNTDSVKTETVNFAYSFTSDDDNDGIGNDLEIALGTDPKKVDSDNDTYSDRSELINDFNPLGKDKLVFDAALARRNAGRILLQVEAKGQAWYVNPVDLKRYFLNRPADAFAIMRQLGLGAKHDVIVKTKIYPTRLLGRILIDVEDKGKAYYINPKDKKAYYLGRVADAFEVMRKQGLGINNANLKKIKVGGIK